MTQIETSARLSVAPMMDWTDRHCRAFHRLITRHALLYTEMVTAPALVRGRALHLLRFDASEQPVALQLGGSDPSEMAEAARMGAGEGFGEINMNVGCPSDRVQSGTFGAVLMKSPDLVAECVEAMAGAVDVPVTVKCRIGVDDQKPEEVLPAFVARMREAGVTRIAIHARKAWLQGLSPKENREVPPLDYEIVHAIKAQWPDLHVSLNGGIATLEDALEHLGRGLDGVMIGRAAYNDPYGVLSQADARVFGAQEAIPSRTDIARAMIPHIEAHLAEGGRLHSVTRHMLGLFTGQPGARAWRRVLSTGATKPGAGPELLEEALEAVSGGSLAAE